MAEILLLERSCVDLGGAGVGTCDQSYRDARNLAGRHEKLEQDAKYVQLFEEAFGENGINQDNAAKALAQFLRTFITGNSNSTIPEGTYNFTASEQLALISTTTNKAIVSTATDWPLRATKWGLWIVAIHQQRFGQHLRCRRRP